MNDFQGYKVISRPSDKHKCQLPPVTMESLELGMVIECTHRDCRSRYKLVDDQMQGPYWRLTGGGITTPTCRCMDKNHSHPA